jgi:polyisoprenoid-binding protein YceI
MGHRLTIAMKQWHATVRWADGEPVSTEVIVDLAALEVLHGEGGVTSLSAPEKALVRSNALKSLNAGAFPQVRFDADRIEKTDGGYRLTGRLVINGKTRGHVIDLRTEDLGCSWRLSAQFIVRHSDFGVRPYSLLMGSVRVADEVTVAFTANLGKDV